MNTTLASPSAPRAPIWHLLLDAIASLPRRRSPAPEADAAGEAARQAAAVRALADSYRRSDPGFASDLYAAADRHERAFEEVQAVR